MTVLGASTAVQVQLELLHLVGVAVFLIASDTVIEVLYRMKITCQLLLNAVRANCKDPVNVLQYLRGNDADLLERFHDNAEDLRVHRVLPPSRLPFLLELRKIEQRCSVIGVEVFENLVDDNVVILVIWLEKPGQQSAGVLLVEAFGVVEFHDDLQNGFRQIISLVALGLHEEDELLEVFAREYVLPAFGEDWQTHDSELAGEAEHKFPVDALDLLRFAAEIQRRLAIRMNRESEHRLDHSMLFLETPDVHSQILANPLQQWNGLDIFKMLEYLKNQFRNIRWSVHESTSIDTKYYSYYIH